MPFSVRFSYFLPKNQPEKNCVGIFLNEFFVFSQKITPKKIISYLINEFFSFYLEEVPLVNLFCLLPFEFFTFIREILLKKLFYHFQFHFLSRNSSEKIFSLEKWPRKYFLPLVSTILSSINQTSKKPIICKNFDERSCSCACTSQKPMNAYFRSFACNGKKNA